jgi:hypothetical protein
MRLEAKRLTMAMVEEGAQRGNKGGNRGVVGEEQRKYE